MTGRTLALGALIAGLALPAAAQAAAPTGLRVTDLRASGATLSWNAPAGDVYGYSIVDLLSPSTGNQVGYSFTTTGEATLQPRRTYRLAVRATLIVRGNLVDSGTSAPVTVTTPPDTTPPDAPSLRQTTQTATSVSLAWMSGSDDVGVESFVISNGSSTWTRPAWQQWWWEVPDLPTNRTHTFTIRARDAAGNVSPPSNAVAAAIEDVPPSAPRNLRPGGEGLVWEPSTDNSGTISGYRVFVDADPAPQNSVFRPSAPLQVWDDSLMELLPRPGMHAYRVSAFDPSGNVSARSDPVTVAVP